MNAGKEKNNKNDDDRKLMIIITIVMMIMKITPNDPITTLSIPITLVTVIMILHKPSVVLRNRRKERNIYLTNTFLSSQALI